MIFGLISSTERLVGSLILTSVVAYNDAMESDKDQLLKLYKAMQMARGFENACNQQYMQGKIRGFMHLDNGQESIPGLVDYAIKQTDKKFSYYREHTHAIASGVDPGAVMAELFMKDTGTCRGAGSGRPSGCSSSATFKRSLVQA